MRVRPDSWFADLVAAGTKVFVAKGYRQTQMSDIAREMGVSQGTLYNYVESKEALFLICCEQGFSNLQLEVPGHAPVPARSFETMVQKIRERMHATTRLETLGAALRTKEPSDAAGELESVLREFYSVIARYRHGFDLVERSTLEVPELAQILFVEGRRGAVSAFARYIARRVQSGHFRSIPDDATAARFIIEAVTWFARHRHNTRDPQTISNEDALETTIQFLVAGLIPERHAPGRRVQSERSSASGAGKTKAKLKKRASARRGRRS